jgi:adenylyltransferase/sulfurtransferase
VRNHNEGKAVRGLTYEAYDDLAQREAEQILSEAQALFEVTGLQCVHRTGRLAIGDCAVWVGVTAAHRDAAFRACRYVIDAIKHRLPIWKQEQYGDGTTEWVNCQGCAQPHHHAHGPALSEAERAYYQRQLVLPGWGPSAQQRLKQSRVLVVGAGGLGAPALAYLASAGVGTLGIVEADSVALSNLHRQLLYPVAAVGQSKAEQARQVLTARNPHIQVVCHPVWLDETNATSLFRQYDLVLNCTDNFPTQFLINQTAVQLGMPLVHASLYQFEGQLLVVDPTQPASGCLACVWPEPPDALRSCAEAGMLGAVSGQIGAMQALEAIKLLAGLPGGLTDALLLVDTLTHQTTRIQRRRRPGCTVCEGRLVEAVETVDEATSPAAALPVITWETIQQFGVAHYQWVDLRDPQEREAEALPLDAIHVPAHLLMTEGASALADHQADRPVVLICARGLRSRQVAVQLRQQGMQHVYALQGGLQVLAARHKQPVLPGGYRHD